MRGGERGERWEGREGEGRGDVEGNGKREEGGKDGERGGERRKRRGE